MREKVLQNYPGSIDKFDSCEDEPIHLIGRIQSFGFVIVLNPYSFAIEQVSENISDFLNAKPHQLINKRIFHVLSANNINNFTNWLHNLKINTYVEPFTLLFKGKLFTVMAKSNKAYILLEFEPFKVRENIKNNNLLYYASNVLSEFEQATLADDLFHFAAKKIRELTQYDRVLIMKFGEIWDGHVVAESKAPEINSLANHHFPPSDIPKQARQMLANTPLRYIADTEATPIQLEPYVNPSINQPIDLQSSILRNPSEIHLEYLRNMDVRSTITYSIVLQGKLWGIITAHNTDAKSVTFEKRQTIELIGKYFSQRLLFIEQAQKSILRGVYNQSVEILSEQMHERYNIVEGLTKGTYTLLDIVEASGAGLLFDEKLHLLGNCPLEKDIYNIINWFNENANEQYFYTNNLSTYLPEATNYQKEASGLLIIRFSEKADNYIFWFKPEILKEKTWAGNPYINYQKNDLSPRKSFESWTEMTAGHSENWLDTEIEMANQLVKNCMEVEFLAKKYLKSTNEQLTFSLREHQLLIQKYKRVQDELEKTYAFQSQIVEKLSTEKEQVDKFLGSKDNIALLLDLNLKVLFMNNSAKNYFKSAHQVSIKKGDFILDYIPTSEKENFQKNINLALEGKSTREEKSIIQEEKLKWFEEYFYAFNNKKGEIWAIAYDLTDITQRKTARESLENLALIAQNTQSGVIICNSEDEIEWANEAFCKITEYSIQELIGQKPRILLRGAHTNSVSANTIDAHVEKFENFKSDILNYTKSGKEIWLRIEAQAYTDQYGLKKYFTINTDITNEKNAELKLKESNEKYVLLSENSQNLICLLDIDESYLYISPSVKDILGFSQQELSAYNFAHYIHPNYKKKIQEVFDQVLNGTEFTSITYDIKTKAGKYICFQTSIKPIYDEENKVIKVLTSSKDITKQKRQEEEISNLNNKLLSAMEISKVAWWEWDLISGKLLYSSNIYDFTKWEDQKYGDNIRQFLKYVHKNDKANLIKKMRDVSIRRQYYFEENFRLLCGDNKYRWMLCKVLILENNNHEQPSFIKGVLMDINDWKKSQKKLKSKNKQLKKINKELDRFVYSVSHDLRSPISSSLGLIELMSGVNEDDTIAEYLQMQEKSLVKLDMFIRDIVDFSRNNRLEISPEKIEVKQTVLQTLEQLNYFDNKELIAFRFNIAEDLTLYSDKRRFEVILLNLISNAIRYTDISKDKPYIQISAKKTENDVEVIIKDNGIGIEEKYVNRIFEMFFRATNKKNGSGLGLYIVKETVNKLNGEIKVDSKHGSGSEFTLKIPSYSE